jgi:hypothetical protein
MDGAICRCGFTIDHGDLVATRARFVGADERAAALRQAGRFTPIPQAEPGIRTSSDFGALSMVSWCRRSEGLLPGTAESIDAAARASAKIHGLDVQAQEPAGAALMVPRAGGHIETIKRHVMYGLAPWGRLDECANQMIKAVDGLHGPGRLWVLNGVVHPILDDGGVSVSDVGGVPHVWLRSVYFHDPARVEQPEWNRKTIRIANAGFDKHQAGSGPPRFWPRSHKSLADGRVETEVARDDVTYDGTPLGILLDMDRERRQEIGVAMRFTFTAIQRDAVSAYHSDRLRAKLKASAAADKARETSVVVDMEDL